MLVVIVPLVFTTLSYEGFELPKHIAFRVALQATILLAACLSVAESGVSDFRSIGLTLKRLRLAVAAVCGVALAWTLATVFSEAPALSWWGSYQRWSGLYTELSLLAVFLIAATALTNVERVWRLITGIAAAGSIVAVYAMIQHAGLDPITWTNGVPSGWSQTSGQARAFATQGNPGFLGAYLTLTLLLTLAACLGETKRTSVRLSMWWLVAVLQLIGLVLTQARGAWVGAIAGCAVLALLRLALYDRPWQRWFVVGVGVVGSIALALWLLRDTQPVQTLGGLLVQRGGDTVAVRLALWPVVLRTVLDRPLAGFGPDMLGSVIGQYYTPDLIRLEQTPEYLIDRAHNCLLETLASVGVLGTLSITAVGAILVGASRRLLKKRDQVLLVMAALVGHLVEQQFNIDTISASLLAWTVAGAAVGCAWSPIAKQARALPSLKGVRVRAATAAVVAGLAVLPLALMELRPLTADIAYAAGLAANRSGQLAGAVQDFGLATANWPYEPTYWNDLATAELAAAHASTGNAASTLYSRALDSASHALQLDRAHPLLWTNWGLIAGEIAAQTGNQQLAESARLAHRRAITLAPELWVNWRATGATEFNLGDYAAAQAALARALQLWDGDSVTWQLAGETAAAAGDVTGARGAYGKALEIDPYNERARQGLAAL